MDEKSAVERVGAAYEKLTAANARIKSLEKKLADGTLTMKEGAELTDLRAQAFGTAFSGKVLDIAQGERENACTELLRERCDDTDEVAEAAQRAALSRQGLNLTPPTAPFEEDRARKIGHSLEDDTVPDETIQRRAKSATETMIRSQYDHNMKQGAKTCAEAGLKTYIIRDSASGCCKWCDEVAGKFAYGSEPKDVYRRHDNCSCSVVYESGRGARNKFVRQNVWSKQYWSAEQEREYLRLRDEMAPKRLTEKQVQALREQVGGLTYSAQADIIKLADSAELIGLNNWISFLMTEEEKKEVISRGVKEQKAVFSYDTPNNTAMSRLQKSKKEPFTFDVISHGHRNCIEFFKSDYPGDDLRGQIDAGLLAEILRNREDFNSFLEECKKAGAEPTIRLLACSTGDTKNHDDCFAKALYEELGIRVKAPNDVLEVYKDGTFYVGRKGKGEFVSFPKTEE